MNLAAMALIVHITSEVQWQQAQQVGVYYHETLDSEGFIHCSTPQQVVAVANRYFLGQSDLVLLVLNTDQLEAELNYEAVPGGEIYPHLYGPLNLNAVEQVVPFPPQVDGTFELPPALAE